MSSAIYPICGIFLKKDKHGQKPPAVLNKSARLRETNRMTCERRNGMRYECPCGYIYDEEKGDPDHGLAPGTKFEDIPEDWECPVCGLTKETFEKL